MTRSTPKPVVLGRQLRFVEVPADVVLVVVWVAIAVSEGLAVGLTYIWVLAIGLLHGTWVLRMRLLLRGSMLELPLIGPLRRSVDLDSLESIRWRHTGGPASKGTMFVQDRSGHRVPVYVGRFTGGAEWGKLLLDAAARNGAAVDDTSKRLLEEAATTTPGR